MRMGMVMMPLPSNGVSMLARSHTVCTLLFGRWTRRWDSGVWLRGVEGWVRWWLLLLCLFVSVLPGTIKHRREFT